MGSLIWNAEETMLLYEDPVLVKIIPCLVVELGPALIDMSVYKVHMVAPQLDNVLVSLNVNLP